MLAGQLPYNSTSLPNILNQHYQHQAESSMEQYLALIESGTTHY